MWIGWSLFPTYLYRSQTEVFLPMYRSLTYVSFTCVGAVQNWRHARAGASGEDSPEAHRPRAHRAAPGTHTHTHTHTHTQNTRSQK
jgi:hypothetical protein